MPGTRKCPYCAEEISEEAVRCRYCRSGLTALDPESWYRDHPEKRIAGVAAAVAHGLALPVSLVRLGFIVLTFIHFLGPVVYGALWLIVPFSPGEESLLSRAIVRVTEIVDAFQGRHEHRKAQGRPEEPPRRAATGRPGMGGDWLS